MEKVVCVTGASGYIASWLVKLLLQRGYTVRASVRDPVDPKKTEHLRLLDGANKRLHLFKANLLEEGSFDAVVDGCQGVFHTASPCYHDVKDPQADLIDPAVKGTLNVLGSCIKTSSIKRIVVTSSVAAVEYNGRPRTPDDIVDETWYSTPEACKQTKDVAKAHILAYEVPSASGRYCLVERVAHYSQIVQIIHELFPTFQLPQNCADDKPLVPTYQVSKEKAKSLGVDYIPLETSIKETIESLKEKGFVSSIPHL